MANRKHKLKHKQEYLRPHAFNFCCFCRGFCLSILRNDRPFPNCLLLLSQIQSSCTTFLINWKLVWFAWNQPTHETLFHDNGFARRLVLTYSQRLTHKWPFNPFHLLMLMVHCKGLHACAGHAYCNFLRTTIILALFKVNMSCLYCAKNEYWKKNYQNCLISTMGRLYYMQLWTINREKGC